MGIKIIDTLEPASDFPLMEAHSIAVDENGTRLDEHLEKLVEEFSVEVTDKITENSNLPITSGAIYELSQSLSSAINSLAGTVVYDEDAQTMKIYPLKEYG